MHSFISLFNLRNLFFIFHNIDEFLTFFNVKELQIIFEASYILNSSVILCLF